MATIPELAPTLVAAGLEPKVLKKDLRPKNEPKAKQSLGVPPKRIRMVYVHLLRGESVQDAAKHAGVELAVAEAVKAEVDAVAAKLAALEPVDPDAPSEEEEAKPPTEEDKI